MSQPSPQPSVFGIVHSLQWDKFGVSLRVATHPGIQISSFTRHATVCADLTNIWYNDVGERSLA